MMKKLAAAALCVVAALGAISPAQAFPTIAPLKIDTQSNIQQVQSRGGYGWNGAPQTNYENGPRPPRWDRRYRSSGRYYRDRDYYRHRSGSNAGAIIGGLAAGAIIGGVLAQPRYVAPRRYVNTSSSHVSWCYNRYRSYRASDNTFQPYNGPRQQCYSPY